MKLWLYSVGITRSQPTHCVTPHRDFGRGSTLRGTHDPFFDQPHRRSPIGRDGGILLGDGLPKAAGLLPIASILGLDVPTYGLSQLLQRSEK